MHIAPFSIENVACRSTDHTHRCTEYTCRKYLQAAGIPITPTGVQNIPAGCRYTHHTQNIHAGIHITPVGIADVIIYHDILHPQRRGSHVKSETHTPSSNIHPLAHILEPAN